MPQIHRMVTLSYASAWLFASENSYSVEKYKSHCMFFLGYNRSQTQNPHCLWNLLAAYSCTTFYIPEKLTGIRYVKLATDTKLLVESFPCQVCSFSYLSLHLYLCPAHSFTHLPLSNGFWHDVSNDKWRKSFSWSCNLILATKNMQMKQSPDSRLPAVRAGSPPPPPSLIFSGLSVDICILFLNTSNI